MKIDGSHVIVTGGGGFLGRHVVARLERLGAQCVVPRSAEYDLTSEGSVARLFDDHPADAVVHLAARMGGIGANREHPGLFIHANLLMGTLTLEYARHGGIQKYLQVGTVCSYPRLAPVPFREESLWDGYPEETNAPYGVAKRALLVQAQAYRSEYGLNAVTMLPVNLYGPHDDFDPDSSHVIPALIRKMVSAAERRDDHVSSGGRLADSRVPPRGRLRTRDRARARALRRRRPVNVGSGDEISIGDLAGRLAAATGFRGEIRWDPTKPNGQPRRRLDVSRGAVSTSAARAISSASRPNPARGRPRRDGWLV